MNLLSILTIYPRYIFIAILIGFSAFFPAQANHISVISVPLSKQLPSNSIQRIFQDSDGFIWLGTLEGLCRYDGYHILTFRSDLKNPHLLTDNEITCLTEDDNNLWIGTRKGVNMLNKKTYRITTFGNAQIQKSDIKSICILSDKTIWIGADNTIYHYNSDLSLQKSYDKLLPASSFVNCLYEDAEGNIWITAWKQGLYQYNKETDSFIEYPPVGKTNNPFKIYQDNKKQLWICTWGDGVYLFNPGKSPNEMYVQQHTYNKERQLPDNIFYSMTQDDKNNYIWAMSFSGIYAFEYTKEGNLRNVDVSSLFKYYNNIFSEIIKDRDGNLWIGTFSEGVLYINFDKPIIRNYDILSIKAQTGIATSITAIYQNGDEIWVNQNRCGLGIFYPKENKIKLYDRLSKSINLSNIGYINDFQTYPGEVWLTHNNLPLIYRVKKEGNRLILNKTIDLSQIIEDPGNPYTMYEDRQNNIWIATRSNLFIKPYNSERIQHINSYFQLPPSGFQLKNISGMTEDAKGEIWISSTSEGIYRISVSEKPGSEKLQIKNYNQENDNLVSNNITSIFADKTGQVWIGTKEGHILAYDITNNHITDLTHYAMRLVGEGILNIIEDDFGNIWISTKKRITIYNPSNNASRDFTETDGAIVNSFLPNSYFKDKSGNLLFGGNRGISVFNSSEKLSAYPTSNKVLITDIKINNKSVLQGSKNHKFDIKSQYLEIDPYDKNIEITFSSLNYIFPSKLRYAYKMEGRDDDWIYTDDERLFAIYNQLSKGVHKFIVKATDENRLWNSEATILKIYKRPAFYETGWAYAVYTISILLVACYIFTVTKKRIQLINKLKIAQIEKDKSEELTQTKLRYFTNISHDFLTPLTIISCLIDDAETIYNEKIKQFGMIRLNISRLRRLLQQVLDFRKIESGNMELKITQGDIAGFIKDLCENHFLTLMMKKNIRFSFVSTPNQIQACFDADKIDKIIFNLLSNAFKYTPENGEVKIELSTFFSPLSTPSPKEKPKARLLKIQINDTGVGIAPEDLHKIFIPFYNNKMKEAGETNGIGLSLTKELVEIHHGTVSVNSIQNTGTTFTLEIPIDKEDYSESEWGIFHLPTPLPHQSSTKERPQLSTLNPPLSTKKSPQFSTILLTEDNEELLILIHEILSKHYHVIPVTNGLEALETIRANEVDIIVSDVMMPGMDGLELCRILKNNIETSHIPVILLTAKNTTADRIDCYNAGADAYISKPFELKVLEARINNFIANKRNRQKQFKSDFEINISKLEYPSLDEQFLNNAIAIIEKHLSVPDFDINTLADKLNMSKSSLYRKIKSMTDLSPRDFIRNIRLKHACMMLKDKSIPISEVAYSVGFSDPKYFTACFKLEFNVTPSEYQKSV
ncbi:Sensor histidine kinase TmoS [termite gut metagenome]|uniref:Sensor histidine kinase TmoS n=1 Tax=termite gut metagenome TaxID=433724 RepID=A0A5J4SSE7_9ZZZZ